MGRYICEVKKDSDNNKLELVHANNYETKNSTTPGSIKFKNHDEMKEYFHKHCIDEDKLQNSGNGFMYLFIILLFILFMVIIFQFFRGKSNTGNSQVSFGRFSI